MKIPPSGATPSKLELLQQTDSILEDNGLTAAKEFAKKHNISFTNQADLSRQIGEILVVTETNSDQQQRLPQQGNVQRYKDQIQTLSFPIPKILQSKLDKLTQDLKITEQDLIERFKQLNGHTIRNDYTYGSGKGLGSIAWYFVTKDQNPPFVLELDIRKNNKASKAKSLSEDNYSTQIRAINIGTGEELFRCSVDPRFQISDAIPTDGYSFNSRNIAGELQKVNKIDQKLFELKLQGADLGRKLSQISTHVNGKDVEKTLSPQTIADTVNKGVVNGVCLESLIHSDLNTILPSLDRFTGEAFRQVLPKLDLEGDLRKLHSSGDLAELLNSGSTAYTSHSFTTELSDRTRFAQLNNRSIDYSSHPFHGGSK